LQKYTILVADGWKGGGFSAAVRFKKILWAFAPEQKRLQGLKAPMRPRFEAAGLKPRPSEDHQKCR
jgi:hypothetical protein